MTLAPEIIIDGAARLAKDNADRIIAYLLEQRFILPAFNLTDEAQPMLSTTWATRRNLRYLAE